MQSSDAQFRPKPKHSTPQCTFVAEETIHYVKGGNSVYVMLLDASKAFDRIEYVQLFKILFDKGLCPLVCRIIYYLYLNQKNQNKWDNSLTQCFKHSDLRDYISDTTRSFRGMHAWRLTRFISR